MMNRRKFLKSVIVGSAGISVPLFATIPQEANPSDWFQPDVVWFYKDGVWKAKTVSERAMKNFIASEFDADGFTIDMSWPDDTETIFFGIASD